MRNARVNLYLRDDKVLVVPAGRYEIDPVLIVDPKEADVQRAIEQTLEVLATAKMPDVHDPLKWVVPKALGLKSAKAFYQNVAHASVLILDGKIQVQRLKPTKGPAFEFGGEPIEVPDISSLGSVALKMLKESPRMNPRA
jgi:hypothetical protein